MKILALVSTAVLMLLTGCSSGSGVSGLTGASPTLAEKRTYSGTAPVGDFLQLTVDPNTRTISYQDLSNGESDSAPFTIAPEDSYQVEDPTGNLSTAYEVPDDLFLLPAKDLGAGRNTAAIAISVPTAPVSVAVVANRTMNYMHLQTSNGGFEIGSGNMDSSGNIVLGTFWPLGNSFEMIGRSPFIDGSIPAAAINEDSSGTFLTIQGVDGDSSSVVADSKGYLISRGDGTYLALEQAASKEFDPVNAGTYQITLYQKIGATSTDGSDESSPSSFAHGILVIGSDGQITLTNSQKQVLAQGTLQPVSDQSYLYNPSSFFTLSDPCYGLFTFQVDSTSVVSYPGSPSGNSTVPTQQSVFVAFRGRTAIIASFTKYITPNSEGPYDYFYGLGER